MPPPCSPPTRRTAREGLVFKKLSSWPERVSAESRDPGRRWGPGSRIFRLAKFRDDRSDRAMNEIAPIHPIGAYVPMVDGPEKVSGRAKYTADVLQPSML